MCTDASWTKLPLTGLNLLCILQLHHNAFSWEDQPNSKSQSEFYRLSFKFEGARLCNALLENKWIDKQQWPVSMYCDNSTLTPTNQLYVVSAYAVDVQYTFTVNQDWHEICRSCDYLCNWFVVLQVLPVLCMHCYQSVILIEHIRSDPIHLKKQAWIGT